MFLWLIFLELMKELFVIVVGHLPLLNKVVSSLHDTYSLMH